MNYSKTGSVTLFRKRITKNEILFLYENVSSVLQAFDQNEMFATISTEDFIGNPKEFRENFVDRKYKHWYIDIDTHQYISVNLFAFNWPIKKIDIQVKAKTEALSKDILNAILHTVKSVLSKGTSINQASNHNGEATNAQEEAPKIPFYKSAIFWAAVGAIGTVASVLVAIYK